MIRLRKRKMKGSKREKNSLFDYKKNLEEKEEKIFLYFYFFNLVFLSK